MAVVTIGCGILLVGLALVLNVVAPGLSQLGFSAILAGGALTVLWGVVAMTGHRRRVWAILTLVIAGFITLAEVVHTWTTPSGEHAGRLAGAIILTTSMVGMVGMLMYLLHGERSADFYEVGSARRSKASGE